jgi:hypothetical protein
MKKPIRYILMFLSSFMFIASQLSAQQVTVTFPKSEPERVKLMLQVKFVDYEYSALDPLRLGFGFCGDYLLPKGLSVHADFNTTYLQVASVDQKTFNGNLNPLANFTFGQACVRLHIIDKTGKQKLKIETGRERQGSRELVHSLRIPFPARKIFGLRAGLFSMVEPVSTDDNGANTPFANKLSGIRTDDGKMWGGSGDPYFTNMNVFGFFGGLSFMSIINTTFDYDGTLLLKRRFRETYIDVMYAPAISFTDIKTANGTSKITPNATGSFKTSNIGARLGISIITPKNFGLGYGFEIGVRPGIQNFGLYFGTKVSLVFGNKTHDFPKETKN